MKIMRRDIWVFIENDPEGRPAPFCQTLLIQARQMADRSRGKLIVICPEIIHPDMIRLLENSQVDDLIVCRTGRKAEVLPIATEISIRADRYRPLLILFPDTPLGKAAAPMTAVLSGCLYMSECERIFAYARNGRLQYSRQSFGGALTAKYRADRKHLQVAVLKVNHDLTDVSCKQQRLEDARLIIAGGRGVGGPEGFLKLQKLADALGGAVGASRAAVDAGWISKDHLIGQSGKTVRPDLYINFGISGSVQHITGMRGAGHVISVNTDPKAFIFDISDEAIVADLFQVLPALETRLRKDKKTY